MCDSKYALPGLYQLFGKKPTGSGPCINSLSTTDDVIVDSWGFVFGGLVGASFYRWDYTSFGILFLIFGSVGAVLMHVLSHSTTTTEQEVLYNLIFLKQDWPVYILISVFMAIGTILALVVSFILLAATVGDILEPFLFFLPGINENAILWDIIWRLTLPMFFGSMMMGLFLASTYAFPLSVILWWYGWGSTPVGPDGRTDFDYLHIPADLIHLLMAVPITIWNDVIKGPFNGEYWTVLGVFPDVLGAIGYSGGSLVMDVASGKLSSSADKHHSVIDVFTVTYDTLKNLL